MAQASNNISVNVTMGHKTIRVSISRDATSKDLVRLVVDQEGLNGMCPDCISIRLNGRSMARYSMRPDSQLQFIKDGSNVILSRRISGGGLANVWYKNGSLNVGGATQRQTYEQIPEFSIQTFHVSCKSDKIKGQNMMGFVLYLCDNKQLFYLNGMKRR
eukprot:339952_1